MTNLNPSSMSASVSPPPSRKFVATPLNMAMGTNNLSRFLQITLSEASNMCTNLTLMEFNHKSCPCRPTPSLPPPRPLQCLCNSYPPQFIMRKILQNVIRLIEAAKKTCINHRIIKYWHLDLPCPMHQLHNLN